MEKALVIVESPAKVRTIKRYLGDNFSIESSVGHIRDLPPNRLGVDIESDFAPEYQVISEKKKVIQNLKKAASGKSDVYLALDPDREGEAIAWHIAQELKRSRKFKGQIHRILFHEITKRAIEESLKHPRELNENRFDAQQTRRILDRLVGYQISPILWDKVKRGLSAGRVQSVAVRLVVDREQEIRKFQKEEFWSVSAQLEGANPPPFMAKLNRYKGEKFRPNSEEDTMAILKSIEGKPFLVDQVQKKERKRNPTAPFITSKLQQEAARKLNFTARRTMRVAQQLYEGIEVGSDGPVGLITYMRTDSTRLSKDAVEGLRAYILDHYGQEYLPEKPKEYAKKKGAQDAHEAIRPTSLDMHPEEVKEHLSREQYLLYSLVWKRFVACQMKPAIYDQTVIDMSHGDASFRATGQIMRFDGFSRVYTEGRDEEQNQKGDSNQEDDERKDARLPSVSEGEELKLLQITPQQHFTQPPPRFRESSLVKELEEKGIGRPSTYATILSVIQDKGYVEKREGRFYPTELGELITGLLVQHFPSILDVEFTARMESDLDLIEEGERDWVQLLKDFYSPFEETLSRAKVEMRNIKKEGQETDIVCDACNNLMVIKWGRNGQFLACSTYPECKNTKDFTRAENGDIVIKVFDPAEECTDETCAECESPMIVKKGRFGRFLACSTYPDCKYTKAFSVGVACPRDECGGDLVEKRSRKGKVFYSCSNYPDCDYALWNRPIKEECPNCKHPFLTVVEKRRKNLPAGIHCPSEECDYYREP